MTEPTAKQIWEKLSTIDVSKHTEKKGNLTYLSWAWAWGVLMEHFPQAIYQFDTYTDAQGVSHDVQFLPDGTASVSCTVTIGDVSRSMWLPVMDNRNNAIPAPDARKISDTKMRCLVKCLAMFGLGHYIYAGEDLPTAESEQPPRKSAAQLKKSGEWNKATELIDRQTDPEELIEHMKTVAMPGAAHWPVGWVEELREYGNKHLQTLKVKQQLGETQTAAE